MTGSIITIQPQLRRNWKIESITSYGRRRLHKFDGKAKIFHKTFKANVEDINTEEKFAQYVFDLKGFGEWNLLVRNKYQRSKTFSHSFTCTKGMYMNRDYQGGHWGKRFGQILRCKYYPKPCSLWQNHQKGMTCRMNRRFKQNWGIIARIKFDPADNERGYHYTWFPKKSKMHRFWWWKGKEKNT